jgi:hypothetical protein
MFLTSRRAIISWDEQKQKSRKGKPVCVLLHTEMGMEWISVNTHA